jgi:hypothetical protein
MVGSKYRLIAALILGLSFKFAYAENKDQSWDELENLAKKMIAETEADNPRKKSNTPTPLPLEVPLNSTVQGKEVILNEEPDTAGQKKTLEPSTKPKSTVKNSPAAKVTPKNRRKIYDHMTSHPPKHIIDAANKAKIQAGQSPATVYQQEYSEMLFVATHKGDVGAINALLNKGANINSQAAATSYTPLMYAVKASDIRTVRYLIARGANVNIVDKNGMTALHIAAINGNTELVDLLVKMGADVARLDHQGRTAAEYVPEKKVDSIGLILIKGYTDLNQAILDYVRLKQVRAVAEAITQGANIDTKDTNGETPLIIAARNNDVNMVSLLLSLGASPTVRDNNGISAQQTAEKYGYKQIAQIIETVAIQKELQGIKEKSPLVPLKVQASQPMNTTDKPNYSIYSSEEIQDLRHKVEGKTKHRPVTVSPPINFPDKAPEKVPLKKGPLSLIPKTVH